MDMREKDACNALYDAIDGNSLSQEQIASLLARGCAPEFRSLAGILQDAADMGKQQAYEAGSTILLQQMQAATAAADERAVGIVRALRPETPESQLHTLLRDDAMFYDGQYQVLERIEQRIKERT